MIKDFALMTIWGIPIVIYSGFDFLFALIITAFIGSRISKGKCRLPKPMLWHKFFAGLAILLGIFYVILVSSTHFGF